MDAVVTATSPILGTTRNHAGQSPVGLGFGSGGGNSSSSSASVWSPTAASLHSGRTSDQDATLPRTPIMSPSSTASAAPYDTPMSPLSPTFPIMAPVIPLSQAHMDAKVAVPPTGLRRISNASILTPSTVGTAGLMSMMTPGASPMRQPCRTIYLGGLPSDADARAILDQVYAHGIIESVRMLPERGCAFISFLSSAAATAFHNEHAGATHGTTTSSMANGATTVSGVGAVPAGRRPLIVNGQEVKVSWGKPSPVPLHVLRAAEEEGATRAVYISGLTAEDTEPRVRSACEQFGEVETLRWYPDRRVAFVHFTCIADAVRCLAWFCSNEGWKGRRVGYARDRCVLVNGALQPDGPSTGLSPLDSMDLGRGTMAQQPQQPQALPAYQGTHAKSNSVVLQNATVMTATGNAYASSRTRAESFGPMMLNETQLPMNAVATLGAQTAANIKPQTVVGSPTLSTTANANGFIMSPEMLMHIGQQPQPAQQSATLTSF
jgi:hypothetical protein